MRKTKKQQSVRDRTMYCKNWKLELKCYVDSHLARTCRSLSNRIIITVSFPCTAKVRIIPMVIVDLILYNSSDFEDIGSGTVIKTYEKVRIYVIMSKELLARRAIASDGRGMTNQRNVRGRSYVHF